MSLKRLRKEATTPREVGVTCPSCGQTVPYSKIGAHHATCPGWKIAIDDAKKTPRAAAQSEIVKQHVTFSARTFPAIIGSKLVQNHWLWMIFTLCSLFFLVGYTFPLWWPLLVFLPFMIAESIVVTLVEVRSLWSPKIFRRKQTK